ncbi:MAG: proprotein convertase P-domain-containing protein [Saprospiraceae bacterium]
MAITLRTKALLLVAGLFGVLTMRAQNHLITEGTIRDCDGFFLDSGGNTAGYSANEKDTVLICSDNTSGTHVQLVFSRVELAEGDDLCFFDGNTTGAPQLVCLSDFQRSGPLIVQATAANASGCLTVVFSSNATVEGNGWSADINCIQPCQTIQAELVSTDPVVAPADTGWIDICIGERISFTGRGRYPQNGVLYQHSDADASFTWDFGDGTDAVGPSVTKTFTKSGGYVVQLTIQDRRGCKNTNFISQRVRVSTKPTFAIGDSIPSEICTGDTVALNATVNRIDSSYSISAISNEGSFQAGGTRSDSLALPDGTGTAYETVLKFTGFSPGQTLTDVSTLDAVCVNMEHTWLRDLEIELTCPNGQSITLHNFGGRSGAEVYLGEPVDFDGTTPSPGQGFDYCWTMDATRGTWLEYANQFTPRTLPAGDYKPFESFEGLVGCPLNGEWKIRVQDLWAIDNGFIFSWGIDFDPSLFPDLEKFKNEIVDYSWQNNPSIFDFSTIAIQGAPRNAGTASYVFRITDDFGCVYDTTVNVTVLPTTHPRCRDCEQILTPARDTAVCDVQNIPLNVGVPNLQTQTSVLFEATPNYKFGADTHNSTNPYNAPISVSGIFPLTITNVTQQIESVCFDLETDWLDDIQVYLVSPNGKIVDLTTNNGGGGAGAYRNTCFSPTSNTPITGAAPPFTGTFRPEGNWTNLNGVPITGNWNLRVVDAAGPEELSVLKSWTIKFRSTNAVQYTWTPAAGLSCTNCPNPTARPTAPTNYIVTAKDNYNCTSTDTVTISVLRNAAAPQVTCGLAPDSSGLLFNWAPLPGFTAYEVRATINGVTSAWRGPINDVKYLVDSLKNNDTVSLEVRAYVGNAPVNCTVESGSSSCVFIICELDIAAVSSTPVDCFGGNTGTASVVASGGTGTYKYAWNDPLQQISANAVFLKAGTYRVSVTDANECLGVADVTVSQPDSILINPQIVDALCVGEASGSIIANVTGGVGNYIYVWSNGQTGNRATNLKTGSYTLSVTDANGCMVQQAIAVDEPDTALTVAITQTFRGCNGTRGNQATALANGGTGTAYNYVWSDGKTGGNVNGLDSIVYTVTVTDVNGCKASNSLQMKDLQPITASIIQKSPSCNNFKDGALGVNIVTGGVGKVETDYTFRWSTGQTGNAISNLAGGVTYSVTVTDAQGCIGVTSRALEQPEPVAFDIQTTDALCFGSQDGSATVANARGQGNTFTYRWDQAAKGQTTATAIGLTAGSYSVTITDASGCSSTGIAAIGQPTRITSTFETVNNLCFGDIKGALLVKPSGGVPGYSFAWSNGRSTAKNDSLAAGTYQITITDKNNCIHTAAATVAQPDALTAQFEVKDPACFAGRDGSIKILPVGGTAPYQFSLDNKNFSTTSTLIALKANDYKVYVKDRNGCSYLEKVTINDPPRFSVDAGDLNYTIRLGDSLTLQASSINGVGTVSYVWSATYGNTLSCSECEMVVAKPTDMITYEVYAIDEKGCEATDKTTVVVQKIREVAVATGFTPNSDGMNDLLMVHGLPETQVNSFRVYDRWGELLFEDANFKVNDQTRGWDGNFRGTPMSAGVYIWYLEVKFSDGMTQNFKGQTTLIR